MSKKIGIALFILVFLISSTLHAQMKKGMGMPLTNVVVSEISAGMVAPEVEFAGTVYYPETSDVASEVDGKVEEVWFEEGQRIKKGEALLKLNSELLEKTLQSNIASHEEVLAELEKAEIELIRIKTLYMKELVSEQKYDERRFKVKGLEKRAASLEAEVERLEVELQKKVIRAPFNGIVVKKYIERGEWLSPGATAATIARDDVMVIVVEVPERVIRFVKKGIYVDVTVSGKTVKGKVITVVPKGDVSTRTFPVKIGIRNTLSLIEGMEARVSLPAGKKKKALMVPRDAVIRMFDRTVVFVVIDSKASMIPVKVVGYKRMKAGIHAEGLKKGMKVVVKGNERLRDGQAVRYE